MSRTFSTTGIILLLVAAMLLPQYAQAQAIAGKTKSQGAWLGVRIKSVKTENSADGKTADEQIEKKGAVVDGVVDGSPAEKAGIKKGDIIMAIGDRNIEDADDLVEAVSESAPGTKVNVSLLRDGKTMPVEVELSEAKAGEREKRVITRNLRVPRSPLPPTPPMIWHGKNSGYGFSLNTLNKQLGEYFGAADGKGVVVERVDEDSDAAKAGFKAGDVIIRAGKKTVTAVSDFRSVLGAFDAGEKIPVEILRKGSKQTIQLTAKEQEKEFSMHSAPGLGGMFRFHSDEDGDMDLDEMENMDIDIDIDSDEIEEGVQRMRIMLNGKELELEHLHESLQDIMEDVQEKMEDVQEKMEDAHEGSAPQRRNIRIEAKQI